MHRLLDIRRSNRGAISKLGLKEKIESIITAVPYSAPIFSYSSRAVQCNWSMLITSPGVDNSA